MVPWWMVPVTAIVAGALGALAAYGEFNREMWTESRHAIGAGRTTGITTVRMDGANHVQEVPGKRAHK